MKIITPRDNIRDAFAIYGPNSFMASGQANKFNKNQDPETITEEEVERIMGSIQWTHSKCDECEQYVKTVVELGEQPDFESRTVRLCLHCLRAALKLL